MKRMGIGQHRPAIALAAVVVAALLSMPAVAEDQTGGNSTAPWGSDPGSLWAYRPIGRSVPPLHHGLANPVDAFILDRLAEKSIEPAPVADAHTLVRRIYFDLFGLPPTAEDVERLAADPRPDAWSRLVDRMLASPRYGEQWARHWLDVVRYADTAGYSNDFERPNAWRYRDYVIRSFNRDKPFNQFLVEQLAGDELDPDDPEMRIAVGFLRMGPWEHTGMSVKAVTRQLFLDDVTHSFGVTFLGLTLRCARCHDHKFDPIPMADYYAVQACFATTQLAERPAAFLRAESRDRFEQERARLRAKLAWIEQELAAIRDVNRQAIAKFLRQNGYERLQDVPIEKRPTTLYGLDARQRGLQRMFNKWRAYYRRALRRYEPLALSVYNGPDNDYRSDRLTNRITEPSPGQKPPTTHILPGGDLAHPGNPVKPGVLSAVTQHAPRSAPPRPLPDGWSGRRLALARWAASDENPLTPRVIANRVWQYHFGNLGLVRTPNNFGVMGDRPSHPELLDFLARYLIEHNWSLKRLHRLILCSETYRRSSEHPQMEAVRARDPQNRLLAYFPPRRLEAEELRDAMLAASGELNLSMGGPGVYEEIEWEVALQPRHIMGTVAPAYQPSPLRRDRHRRSIYLFRIRTLRDPFLEVFNQPDLAKSCPRRDQSTVPTQVFALFNSRWSLARSVAMAQRIARVADDDQTRIRLAFRYAFQRDPLPEEQLACIEFLARAQRYLSESTPVRWSFPTSVERRMIEEVEGVEYTWTEELDRMKVYEPDPAPADLALRERALAALCHVLLKSNEFVYVF